MTLLLLKDHLLIQVSEPIATLPSSGLSYTQIPHFHKKHFANTVHCVFQCKFYFTIKHLQPPGPFIFGPGRDTDLCSATCGSGFLLQLKPCVPTHPSRSCSDLPVSEILSPGQTPCYTRCEGGSPSVKPALMLPRRVLAVDQVDGLRGRL